MQNSERKILSIHLSKLSNLTISVKRKRRKKTTANHTQAPPNLKNEVDGGDADPDGAAAARRHPP